MRTNSTGMKNRNLYLSDCGSLLRVLAFIVVPVAGGIFASGENAGIEQKVDVSSISPLEEYPVEIVRYLSECSQDSLLSLTNYPEVLCLSLDTCMEDGCRNMEKYSLNTGSSWPKKGVCSVGFSLPENSWVHVGVFDLDGTGVLTITNEYFSQGDYLCFWENSDAIEIELQEGIYILKMMINGNKELRKMILIE